MALLSWGEFIHLVLKLKITMKVKTIQSGEGEQT
jgi:hypothetical protein